MAKIDMHHLSLGHPNTVCPGGYFEAKTTCGQCRRMKFCTIIVGRILNQNQIRNSKKIVLLYIIKGIFSFFLSMCQFYPIKLYKKIGLSEHFYFFHDFYFRILFFRISWHIKFKMNQLVSVPKDLSI